MAWPLVKHFVCGFLYDLVAKLQTSAMFRELKPIRIKPLTILTDRGEKGVRYFSRGTFYLSIYFFFLTLPPEWSMV